MKQENRIARQNKIEAAAYEVLEKKGFSGASMLAIARQAKASNETLYRWYGDKLGLFSALVERNAAEVKSRLEEQLSQGDPPLDILEQVAPALLALLLSPRAIALNRAAAADATGQLGAAIAQSGRSKVAPLIGQTLERARAEGVLQFVDTQEAVSLFLNLLVGDLQIRRAIGRVPPLSPSDCDRRAERALDRFKRLLSPNTQPMA